MNLMNDIAAIIRGTFLEVNIKATNYEINWLMILPKENNSYELKIKKILNMHFCNNST